jgi:c(7)-type cytochrome triheme protein
MRWRSRLAVIAAVLALPVVGLAIPDTIRIPRAKDHPAGTPQASALFSHWGHNSYRCYACHPAVFPQARLAFTHADMNDGKFCGSCHRVGGFAPAIARYQCERCHVSR